MKFFKIIILLFVMFLSNHNALAQNGEGIAKINQVETEAKETLNLFISETPEVIYAQFDPILKAEAPFSDFEKLMLKINKMIGHIGNLELINSQYSENEGGIYSYVYNIETEGNRIEYLIHLKKSDSKYHIRGFNFKLAPSAIAQKGFTPLHIFIAVLFGTCIIAQIWCLIFFARRKNLKRKWLYIITSFIGFPIGVGINWASGAFLLRFGFNVPAVSVSWRANQPGFFTMSVFFPLGLLFWLKIKNKRENRSTPEVALPEKGGAQN